MNGNDPDDFASDPSRDEEKTLEEKLDALEARVAKLEAEVTRLEKTKARKRLVMK